MVSATNPGGLRSTQFKWMVLASTLDPAWDDNDVYGMSLCERARAHGYLDVFASLGIVSDNHPFTEDVIPVACVGYDPIKRKTADRSKPDWWLEGEPEDVTPAPPPNEMAVEKDDIDIIEEELAKEWTAFQAEIQAAGDALVRELRAAKAKGLWPQELPSDGPPKITRYWNGREI